MAMMATCDRPDEGEVAGQVVEFSWEGGRSKKSNGCFTDTSSKAMNRYIYIQKLSCNKQVQRPSEVYLP